MKKMLVAIEGIGRGTARDDRPYGIITYDETGHMAVQMVYRSARRTLADGSTEKEKADRGNQVTYYVAENGRGGLYSRKEDTVRKVIWERLPPK